MDKNKNILVTTLGVSWQILPELVGWTNPDDYDFFTGNIDASSLRNKHRIQPVGQFWVVTTENQKDFDKLKQWCKKWQIDMKLFICKGVDDLTSEEKIKRFRSFLFRVVLHASELIAKANNKLYLSLTGGRKSMSTDMFEAGTLFGCDAMFHIVDIQKLSDENKKDNLLDVPGKYANFFLPVIVNEKVISSFIISTGERRIQALDFPLNAVEDLVVFNEDGALEQEISRRKQQSSQVYSNFYARIRNSMDERDTFRKLYFLHPDILQKLKNRIIGKDTATRECDMDILRSLPKADLHTHLGGVLSPIEIIEVAKIHPHPENVGDILQYCDRPADLERKIFGEFICEDKFYGIGLNPYRNLGDHQGSRLLQTKETIRKTIEIYAAHLIEDKVKYVEIRCSPYNYTREGLSIDEVVDTIIETMDNQKIAYGLIYIIARHEENMSIKNCIDEAIDLMNRNHSFRNKLVGIDLAGDESINSPKELRALFLPFLYACVHITIHAGETQPVDNIWEAVYHLSADRIGHGLKLCDNEELMRRFIDKNIGIEMCPSSNRQIVGYGRESDETYPLKKYMENGLKVTISTDNQGISRTSMSNEFYEAARLCGGLSLWDCLVLIRNSLIVSFTDKKTKMKLLQDFENILFVWCNQQEHLLYIS